MKGILGSLPFSVLYTQYINGQQVRGGKIPFNTLAQYSKELKAFAKAHNRTVVINLDIRGLDGKPKRSKSRRGLSNTIINEMVDAHHRDAGIRISAASEGAHPEFAKKLLQTREQAIREYEEANGPRQFTMTRGEALDAFNKGTGVARTNKILRTIVGVK
jgi:hypothetical protein